MDNEKNIFRIKNAEFVTSVALGQAHPEERVAEIAIVGKSNVGKSSLINSLCNNSKLARTSQQPGKTRMINYFLVNREFYLVDLPGYGFAKASKAEQEKWGVLIEEYLRQKRVTHLFLLLDIRHEPTREDRAMFQWILYYGIPFTLIATKADKIAKSKRSQEANRRAKELGAPPAAIFYSSETQEGRLQLIEQIGRIYEDAKKIERMALDTL